MKSVVHLVPDAAVEGFLNFWQDLSMRTYARAYIRALGMWFLSSREPEAGLLA